MKKEHWKDNEVVSGILDWSGLKAQIFRWKVFNNKLTTNNKFLQDDISICEDFLIITRTDDYKQTRVFVPRRHKNQILRTLP